MDTYDQGKERLTKLVSQLNSGWSPPPIEEEIQGETSSDVIFEVAQWSPTPLKKEIQSFAKRLIELADDLDQGNQSCFDIEEEHDKEPLREFGADGMPIPVESRYGNFKTVLNEMRALAASANRAADSLPNSRAKHALPFAAMGLLHLRVWHDKQISPIDTYSPVVTELEDICKRAGICKGAGISLEPETIRNALRTQYNQFDPHFYPPGIWEIVSGD